MEKFKKINYKAAFLNLILIIFIMAFVSLFSKVFGIENNYLGVGVITTIFMCSIIDIDLAIKDSTILIVVAFVIMSLASYIGRLNIFLGISINFITVFSIVYIFSKKVANKTFVPFMLSYIFLEGNPITIDKLPIRILATLIGGAISAIVYYLIHKKRETVSNISLYKYLSTIGRDSLNFNFAIRMAIGVAIAMAIGNYFNLEKSMWIGLTVMSLTEPHFDQTKEKIKYRLFGTFLGALIFMIIFKFVIPKSLTIYVVLLLNYTYMFIKEYKARMVFTTMNALGATMVLYDISVSVPMRISFILGGTVIAFIVNKVLYDRFIKKDKKLITYIYD